MYEDANSTSILEGEPDINETQINVDDAIKQECKIDLKDTQITYIKEEITYFIDNNEIEVNEHNLYSYGSYLNEKIVKHEDIKDVMEIVVKHEKIKDEASDIETMLHSSDLNSDNFDCGNCGEDNKGYCLTCTPVSHFLNNNILLKNFDATVTSNDIVKIKDASERNGVIALKTFPENVIFGPFEGVSPIKTNNACLWQIKNKKLMNIKNGNWMQYVNCAESVLENNIEVFQFNANLYFQTNRQINQSEELLLYYRDEEIKKSDDSEDYYFMPMNQEASQVVYACTLCYLGFNSNKYLIKHKTKCLHSISDCSELIQCCQCDIWLEKQEYLEHHASSCQESNSRCLEVHASRRSYSPMEDHG